MTKQLPTTPAHDHSSRWVRFVLTSVSIRGISWGILALSLLATAVVCQQTWHHQVMAREQQFDADSAFLRNTILERIRLYAHVLQGVSGLFDSSEEVTAAEFNSYVGSLDLDRHLPGILALGYVEMVDGPDLDAFRQNASEDRNNPGVPFTVKPSSEKRDNYMIVRYVEPLTSNLPALGFDVGSEDNRRRTAERARDLATAALTPKLDLVQSPGNAGSILFLPIYRSGLHPVEESSRRTHIQGWVYAAFLVEDIMRGVTIFNPSHLDYEIFDGLKPSPDTLLSGTGQMPDRNQLAKTSTLDVFGRSWTLRIHPPSGGPKETGVLPVGLLAIGGSSISFLIFGIAHSMASTGRRAVSLATDMTTDFRDQQQALRASEERLAMIIEGSSDGVWDWDMTTDEVYYSPRWKSMLGYEDHEIANTFQSWVTLIHPEDRKQAQDMVTAYTKGEVPEYKIEHRLRHKDGGYRWILARGVVSRNENGVPVRMAGSHLDLTELKHAERNLFTANKELKHSKEQLQDALTDLQGSHRELERTQLELIQTAKLESVGTLAAGVAHEVKNPLQIVVMGLDFLDYHLTDVNECTRITLADMRDATGRADLITRELLNFSGVAEFNPVLDDLENALERAIALLSPDLTKSKVTLVRDLAGQLPGVCIDLQKIQQVLINLILNSVQAMDHVGTLRVTSASGRLERLLSDSTGVVSPLEPATEVVILKLLDTGPGIPDDKLPRIFDPFFTTKTVGSGSGLGLSIVKKIIDLHGGLIQVRNSPEGGLETAIALKAVQADNIDCDPPPSSAGNEAHKNAGTHQPAS